MTKTASATVSVEPIERLEQKVQLLIGALERARAEQARTAEEHQRLSGEVETLRSRLGESEGALSALTAMREERDQIRGRVTQMLQQLEAISI